MSIISQTYEYLILISDIKNKFFVILGIVFPSNLDLHKMMNGSSGGT